MRQFILLASLLAILLCAPGCENATYPREKLAEAVKEMCREEYKIEVDVAIENNTLAIYLPVVNLFDLTLNLSENAQKEIQNVLFGATRAALSTDANIQFYCLIAQDVRMPEIQLVVIKYVDDIKRAYLSDISRGDYFKRTLIDINENPQAKKEQSIAQVFEKIKLNKEMQDKVMEDFFRAPPSSLEGIGYWQNEFYIKNITLEEFLAQQIATRVKGRFREEEALKKYTIRSVTGKFVSENGTNFFLVNFTSDSLLFVVDPEERKAAVNEMFEGIFQEASDVIYSYKFQDFDFLKIAENNFKDELMVSKDDIYLFKKRKLDIGNILSGIR